MAERENPALVVDHGFRELKKVRPGGSPRKIFVEVTPAFRKKKAAEWRAAANDSLAAAAEFGFDTGVLKVKLLSTAIAKSHRPQHLLQQAGRTRIIGASHIGTLLVAVSQRTAAAAHDAFLTDETRDGAADLTTIESIHPYTAADRQLPLGGHAEYQLGVVVTLFDYRDPALNAAAGESLLAMLEDQNLQINRRSDRRFLLNSVQPAHLEVLARHPAVRRIWPNSAVVAPALIAAPAGAAAIPPPDPNAGYPVVGVLDGGVSPHAHVLTPWIDTGPTFPPPPPDMVDYSHGTFIAGLIAGCESLNPGVTPLPPGPCRILAARVFSSFESIGIEDLIIRIDETVRAHPHVKVWNLSLGIATPCKGPEFSVFACELDEIALRRRVLFVIAAGNYTNTLPLRCWPADKWHTDDRDIIGPPADSVLGLSVGSIAHAHSDQSAVKKQEPAAYSRRGPAPGLLPKPEIVHYGGNCTSSNGVDGCGIASVAPDGAHSREWGTSYAAPLVASVAAHGWSQLLKAQHDVTPEMVRTLVIHSAALSSPPRKPEDLRYFGFGIPHSLDSVLTCIPSAFTTWHRVYIPAGQFVEHEFPTYQVPFLAHATMEPMNCTVDVRKDSCEVWVGNQVIPRAQATAAKTTGLPLDKVVVHT